MKESKLDEILKKALHEISLSHEEIVSLLHISSQKQLERISRSACELRKRYFENKVFLYGFVYFSTFCRNNCNFCLYRKSNTAIPRYRKTASEIMNSARALIESGVHLIDLTMGEDPLYYRTPTGFNDLLQIVKTLKKETQISVMISPGVTSENVLSQYKFAGVDWYACYQETHNETLYHSLRTGQSYSERMNRKAIAQKMGYLIEEGLLTGVGDTAEDIAHSITLMRNMQADQVRVMSFVPQENTPLQNMATVSRFRELLIIAVMRLVMPDRLIPASLDVDGLKGLIQRLDAGANVVTSIIPPSSGLAGVSQSSLDIEDGNRSIEKIIPVLQSAGLKPATRVEYEEWIKSRKMLLHNLRAKGAI